jgi:hypothetical protein
MSQVIHLKPAAHLSLHFRHNNKVKFTSRRGLKLYSCTLAELNKMVAAGNCSVVKNEDLFE